MRKGAWKVGEERQKKFEEEKLNIELELSNLIYHRNCYRDFVNKSQINATKSTCDHTSSDNVHSTIF